MRSVIIFLLFVCILKYSSAQTAASANELLNTAFAKAKSENKNVFVIFTATWCKPCSFLHYIISDDYNKQYFHDNYVFVDLRDSEFGDKRNLNNAGTREILSKYNGDSTGIPYSLILNARGKKLSEYAGAPGNAADVRDFIKVIKNTSRLKDFDLKQMAERIKQLGKNSESY